MKKYLSDLAQKVRISASNEKRAIEYFEMFLKRIGLLEAFSASILTFGKFKIGIYHINLFRIDNTNDIDKQILDAFIFCGLDVNDPRHWRALLNSLVIQCFPKKGRPKSRDEGSLFSLLLDIHRLQAKRPQLKGADDIARELLRCDWFTDKNPTIKKVSSLTKLIRKAQDPEQNHFVRYREDSGVYLNSLIKHFNLTDLDEAALTKVLPLFENTVELGNQLAQEEDLLERFRQEHFRTIGRVPNPAAEQKYTEIIRNALRKRLES